jgi:DNA polymerase-3 subunit delta'
MSRSQPPPPTSAAAEPAAEPPARAERHGLQGIVGQPQVKSVLLSALRHRQLHHAYLFDGPEGVGKATCARALFAALNCLEPPELGGACGVCSSCSKLASGNHPDLISFDMTLSGLADEAERLIRRLQYPPFESKAQVVIFDPADQFSMPTAVTAANRLLKTLEEPRPATHFFLITAASNSLLQTIRSRCQRLRFAPLSDAELGTVLRRGQGAGGDDLATVLKLAQGSLGRAARYLDDREQLGRQTLAASDLYIAASDGRVGRFVELASDIGADREGTLEVLDLLWLRLHDELRSEVASSQQPGASRRSERLLGGLRAVRSAQQAIRGYTGAPLAIERLLRHLQPAVAASAPSPAPVSHP